jgi:hypothetical protein
MDPPCSAGCLFVVNLVGAGNAGQLGIWLELVDMVLLAVDRRMLRADVASSEARNAWRNDLAAVG